MQALLCPTGMYGGAVIASCPALAERNTKEVEGVGGCLLLLPSIGARLTVRTSTTSIFTLTRPCCPFLPSEGLELHVVLDPYRLRLSTLACCWECRTPLFLHPHAWSIDQHRVADVASRFRLLAVRSDTLSLMLPGMRSVDPRTPRGIFPALDVGHAFLARSRSRQSRGLLLIDLCPEANTPPRAVDMLRSHSTRGPRT